MENKNIQETLNSLDKLQRAVPQPGFYDRLAKRIEKGEAVIVFIKPSLLWQAAACIAVLVVLNVFTWVRSGKVESISQENTNPIAKEYFSYLNTPQF